jgi:hypothetical protein
MMDKLRGAMRSTVIWLNGLMLAAFPLVEMAKDALPDLGQYLAPGIYKWVGLFVVVANIGLRFKTHTSLASKA